MIKNKKYIHNHSNTLIVNSNGELLATNDNKRYFIIDGLIETKADKIDPYSDGDTLTFYNAIETEKTPPENDTEPIDIDLDGCIDAKTFALFLLIIFFITYIINKY